MKKEKTMIKFKTRLKSSIFTEAGTYDSAGRPISYKGNSLSWVLMDLYTYGGTTFYYLDERTRYGKISRTGSRRCK